MASTQRPARTHPSPRRPVSLRARVGALAVATLALVGCGSVTAPQTAARSAGTAPSGTAPAATFPAGTAAPGTGAPVAASRLLCARPGAVRRVVITRFGVLPRILPARAGSVASAGPTGSPLPPDASIGPHHLIIMRPRAVITVVTSAARARALARAVCGLPAFPHQPVRCPGLIAGSYRLSFTAGGRQLPPVIAQDSGCRAVTGLGSVRTAASRPAFWKTLSQLAGTPFQLPVNPGGPSRPLA